MLSINSRCGIITHGGCFCMSYTKLEIQEFRQEPIPQWLVEKLLQATTHITYARVESNHTVLKKILADVMLIDEVRCLSAFYGEDHSHKNILLALCDKNNLLGEKTRVLRSCARYAETMRNTYKILLATDFLKINDALKNGNAAILEKHIDSKLSILVDSMWKILNEFYSPENNTPMLLRLALMWAELEEGFFYTTIHLFSKTLMLNHMLNDTFEIDYRSLFITKRIITNKHQSRNLEAFVTTFLQILTEAAFDKLALIADLSFHANTIKNEIHEKLPRLYSENILSMFNEHLLINNAIAEETLHVSNKTAISYLKQLEAAGLLRSERVGRERYYLNVHFIECIEKDFR